MISQVAFGYVLGALTPIFWSSIPSLTLSFMVILVLFFVFFRFSQHLWLLGCALGYLSALNATMNYRDRLNQIAINPEYITITAQLNSLSNALFPTNTLNFTLLSQDNRSVYQDNQVNIRLSSNEYFDMRSGDIWKMSVRLSRPYGVLNAAGQDRERYFVGQSWHGQGYIVSAQKVRSDFSWQRQLQAWRQSLFERVVVMTESSQHAAFLWALSFGERVGITHDQWQQLKASGLSHLIAISGLHIGLAACFGCWLGKKCRAILPERRLFWFFPLVVTLIFSCGYAWLAGFTVPTLRSLIMVLLWLGLTQMCTKWSFWRLLWVTLSLCLFVFPLSFYSSSFWLSFGAVTVLFFAMHWNVFVTNAKWSLILVFQRYCLLQCVLCVGLLPIQFALFGGFSLLAPLMNLVAIPLVSFITVPCILLGLLFLWIPVISHVLFWFADWSLWPLFRLMAWSSFGWLELTRLEFIIVCGGLLSAILLWVLRKRMWRWQLTVVFCWMGIGLAPYFSERKQWQLHMFDVGHGLALAIEHQGEQILYDTEAAWEKGNWAQSVVQPWLLSRPEPSLAGIIVSHGDSDHAGGLDYLQSQWSEVWLRSSEIPKRAASSFQNILPCVQGEKWIWHNLTFEMLWPPVLVYRAYNPHSCVVKVSDVKQFPDNPTSVLLTGDIDAVAELLLLRVTDLSDIDVVLVPHHGSLSSSTKTWLSKMDPQYALVSTARFNRWQLPKKEVQRRYQEKGAIWLNTAKTGQVSLTIQDGKIAVMLQRLRKKAWFRPSFRPIQ